MIKVLSLICLILFSNCVYADQVISSVGNTALLNNHTIKYVMINLNSKATEVEIVAAPIGKVKSFSNLINTYKPIVAINGGFFCMKTYKPIGDVRTKNVCYYGSYGYDMLIKDGQVFFLTRQDARQCTGHLLGLGPRLVWKTKIALDPKAEGFNDSVHFTKRTRSLIGLTKANKLIFAVSQYPMLLSEAAKAMQAIGCTYAFGLDGGSSTGLYYNKRFIVGPGRMVQNFVVSIAIHQ